MKRPSSTDLVVVYAVAGALGAASWVPVLFTLFR